MSWRVAVLCTAALTVLFAALALPLSGPVTLVRFWTTLRGQALTWGLWLLLLPLVVAAARRAHLAGVLSLRGISVHLLAGSTLALVHAAAFGYLRWALGFAASDSVRGIVVATVAFVVGGDLLRYVVIVSAYHAAAYASEARERAVREARMAATLAEARLAALEQRLHPHFLFNTLNGIAALIPKEPRAAQEMVGRLGDLLRAALNAEPGREVSLAGELELLERYTAIESARFPDRLRVIVRAGPEARGAYVPQMILQPLVENAIRHGVAPRDAPGTVVVEAARDGEALRLTVMDDGVGFGGAGVRQAVGAPGSANGNGRANGSGFGLAHTRERLAALYGDGFRLDVAPNEPTGTIVTIELPFRDAVEPLPASPGGEAS